MSLSGTFPIKVAEDLPFRANQSGIGLLQGIVGIFVIYGLREDGFGAGDGFRIGGVDDGAFVQEFADYFQRRSEANVVGVGFEGQAEHGNAFAFNDPQSVVDLLEEAFDALLVHALGGLQHVEINADRRRRGG